VLLPIAQQRAKPAAALCVLVIDDDPAPSHSASCRFYRSSAKSAAAMRYNSHQF
jgi:hypothetical protein